MYRNAPLKVPPTEENKFLRYGNFEGINLAESPTQVRPNESPDMLNMLLDDVGALDSRMGFGKLFTTAVGTGQVYGFFTFKKIDLSIKYILHVGTELYLTLLDGTQPTLLYSGLSANLSEAYTFNNKWYFKDSVNYLQYDGTTVVTVESIAYVPTLTQGRAPTGGGTIYEDFNLLGTGFKDSFSGTAATTVYQMSYPILDATPPMTAVVNGAAQTEGVGFTVNRTTGAVTFAAAPGVGTNNVLVTGYKTVAGLANKIKNCRSFVIYGGTNDTRIFWARNATYPNYLFRSGLFDPTYAPELAFTKVGSDSGIIQGFAKQFSSCIILKEPTPSDTTQYSMSYNLDSAGVVTFPIIPLTDDIGVVAPRSIQLLNNLPTYFSQKGVFETVGSNVKDERNVVHISGKIDRSYDNQIQALLAETSTNQQAAISVDYDKKYILVVNNRAYVYDYRRSSPDKQIWYIFDNIHASCFLEINDYLYFGSNTTGLIYKFLKITDTANNSDDGTAINKYWKSRIENFGVAYRFKTVPNVYLSIKPALRTSANLYTIDDQGETVLQDTIAFSQFSFTNFDFANFSFITTNFPQTLPSRVKAKKILYFQTLVSNNLNNQSLGILEVNVEYTVNGLAK